MALGGLTEGRCDMVGVRTALIDTPAMDWSLNEPTLPPLPLPVPALAAAAAPLLSALAVAATFFLAVAMALVATFCSTELDDDTWLATTLLTSLAATLLLLVLLGVVFFLASRSTLETQLVFFAVTPEEEAACPDPAEASPLLLLLLLLPALLLLLVVAEAAEAACSLGTGGLGLVLAAWLEEEDTTGEVALSLKLLGVGGASPCSDDGPDCFRLLLLPWDAPPTSLFFIFMALALAAASLATVATEEVVPSMKVTWGAASVLVVDCSRRCRISWSDVVAASPLLSPPLRLPRLRPLSKEVVGGQ